MFAQLKKKKKYKINVFLNDYSEVDFNFLKKNRLLKIKLNKVNTNRYNLISHIGNLLKKYSKILSKTKPDYLFIIGDRYEAFAMAIACNFLNIRIIHIAGGDITRGSYDDEMRIYISKSAFLNFTTNNESKKNLMQLVKDKKKIFNYGSPSLDYIKDIEKLKKTEIAEKLNIDFNKYNILVTFHPETKNLKYTVKNLKILLSALSSLGSHYNFFITSSNIDTFGQLFNKIIINKVKNIKNFHFFKNLGTERYIQLALNCDMVIGNSSSLIYEIPFIGLKSLLVGSRQEGRHMSKKIIKVKINKELIIKKIKSNIKKKRPQKDFKTYGNGFASINIFKKVDRIINE